MGFIAISAWTRIFPKGDEREHSGPEIYDDHRMPGGRHRTGRFLTSEMPFHSRRNTAAGATVNDDFFVRFAKVVFQRYQHKVKYWMTFNEINNRYWHEDFAIFTNTR